VIRVLHALVVAATILCAPTSPAASFDDGSRYAFSASPEKNRVYAFDLRDQEVAGQIDFPQRPDQVIASDALDALVVSHRDGRRLTLVDLTDDKLAQFAYPLDLTPDYIKLSPLGDTVAIYDTKSHRLEVHAIKRHAVLLSVTGIEAEGEFTFSPDGLTLYWLNNTTGTLHSIDLWSKRGELRLGQSGGAFSPLSRSADGRLGFVSSASRNTVFVIDLRNFTLFTQINVPSDPGRPWGTADGRYMFVAGGNSKTVSAISTSSLRLEYSVRLDDRPISVHSGWLDTVAAITGESGSITFIDVRSGKILKTHQLGQRPLEAVVTSDSKTMAIPLPDKGEFAFISMRKQSIEKILRGLPVGMGAATIAISNNLCH